MTGTAALALGVLAATAALVLGVLAIVPAKERVALSRLDPTIGPPPSALTGLTQRAQGGIETVLARRDGGSGLARDLQAAGLRMRPADFVLLSLSGVVVAGALGLLLGGPVVGVLLAALAPLVAKVLLSVLASRRRAAFADQLDDSLQLMASSLRAGHSILRAVDSVAQEGAAPTSEEFARIINETRVGRDLGAAIDEVADRMGSEDFAWVAQAIAIQREVGGNLAEVLDRVGHTIRERNAIRRQVKALSAEGKLSAYVLMALPIGVGLFLFLTRPEYMGVFTESLIGYAMLAAVAVLLTAGGLWLRTTVRITF
ncbi:type II secretion system F family protein [Blastococcus sp. HT6-30]|uniref:type II secretion system F family protein n=1 Tax=Blastococcus sp. HT6-30 TaxID=3144843 RepID=UPI00321BA5F2